MKSKTGYLKTHDEASCDNLVDDFSVRYLTPPRGQTVIGRVRFPGVPPGEVDPADSQLIVDPDGSMEGGSR